MQSIPLSLKKSRLLQAEDPFMFSEMPQMVFDTAQVSRRNKITAASIALRCSRDAESNIKSTIFPYTFNHCIAEFLG